MKLGGKFGKGILKWEVEGKLLGIDFIRTYYIYAQNSQLKREKNENITLKTLTSSIAEDTMCIRNKA